MNMRECQACLDYLCNGSCYLDGLDLIGYADIQD